MLHLLEVCLSFPMIYTLFAVLCFSGQSLHAVLLRRKLPQEKISYLGRSLTLF